VRIDRDRSLEARSCIVQLRSGLLGTREVHARILPIDGR
jgi:hypothetical protein